MDSSKTNFTQSQLRIIIALIIICFLIIGISAAFYLSKIKQQENQQIIHQDVNHQLAKIITEVEQGVGLYEYGLQSLKSAIESTGVDNFTYQHNLEYFKGWDYQKAFPGARGFGFIRSVDAKNLPEFLAKAKAERKGEFELKQLTTPEDPLFIIQYIEPEINNYAAVGLDIGSEITRRKAALRSVISGNTQLTGPITLVQEDSKVKHGFLLLLPIYKKANENSLEKPIAGWSYAPLVIGEILANVANLNTNFHFKISDVSSTDKVDFYNNYDNASTLTEFSAQQSFNLFGRTWQVNVTPNGSYLSSLNLMSFTKLFSLITLAFICFLVIVTLVVIVINNRLKNINEKKALALMVNNLDDCIIGVDSNFTILTLNDAAAELFDLSFNNDKPIIDYLNVYFPTEVLIATFKRIARGLIVNDMTFQVKANEQDTSNRDFLLSISPIFQKEQFYGATISISDITQLKTLQNQLEVQNSELQLQVEARTKEINANQELQRSVLNSNNMAIIATDKNGVITLINRGAEKFLGCSEHSIIGRTLFETLLPVLDIKKAFIDKNSSEQAKYDDIIAIIKAQKFEAFTLTNTLGEKSQINISISDIHHTNGSLLTLTDVSETWLLKKQLTLVNEALNNSQDILLWCDINGSIKFANPFASIALGYTPKLFQTLHITKIMDFNEKESWEEIANKVLVNDRYSFEIHFIDSTNQPIPTLVSLNKLQIANESYIYLAAKDISYQKQQAKQLNTALINADTANETKVLFLSNISHELRTPLHAINGMMQLLQSTELNNKQLSYIQSARRNVTALSTMMNDILEITQSERGILELKEECFDFNNLITKLSEHLILISEKKALEINFEVPANTPDFLIADPNKLLKILLSLTENAVKFTEQGLIAVKFRIDESSDKQAKLLVEVKDTGIGISEEKLTSIFNLFNQTDSALNRQYGGIGMGLALAREFIKLMNGKITVESKLGIGTTIKLSVDIKVKHQPVESNDLLESLADLNVLIVDDNPTSLQILGDIVSHLGCYTTVTDSPENALILFESAIKHNEKFDVALIDWKMPDIDGWELAEKMRAIDTNNQMPLIVMVTAHTKQMFAHRRDSDTNILNGFVTKPVTKQVLIDALLDTVCAKEPEYIENKTIINNDGPLFNKRILVVEDNPSNQEIAKSLLESLGATVILCSGGYKALFELENSLLKFDLVLMDIQMPDMDGYETTKRIKAIKKFHHLPIIAMTAYVQPSDKAKCFEAGMIGHISKPYEVNDLITQILAATGYHSSSNAEIETNTSTQKTEQDVILGTTVTEYDYLRQDIINFCEANNIALKESMERFSHLTGIYIRSLSLLSDDLADYIEQLTAEAGCLTNQDFKRLFHTLKSTAASLGFTELSQCAMNIDKNYSLTPDYQHTDEETLAILNLINQALELITDLERLLTIESKEPTTNLKELDNFTELFDKLLNEVSNFNMHALEIFQEINPYLTSYSKTKTEALAACLNKLKFKQASAILEQLKVLIAQEKIKEA
ncbi:MAG: response regulator [Thalassotalea sp.]